MVKGGIVMMAIIFPAILYIYLIIYSSKTERSKEFLAVNFTHRWSLEFIWRRLMGTNEKKYFVMVESNDKTYIDMTAFYAMEKFKKQLSNILKQLNPDLVRPVIILCIGTDRCTGDSLGPITGSFLAKESSGRYTVYGTLEDPVHALNIKNILQQVKSGFWHPFIIAVDASLGHPGEIGNVIITRGALKPGYGFKKVLPGIGDICITAVVNDMQHFYSTRLYDVMGVAEFISRGVQNVLDILNNSTQENEFKISR